MIMVLKYGNFLATQAVEQLLPVQAGRVQIPVQTLVFYSGHSIPAGRWAYYNNSVVGCCHTPPFFPISNDDLTFKPQEARKGPHSNMF